MDLDFHLLALLERGTTAAIDDEGRRWNHDVAAHLEEHESCESARPASHAHLLSDFKYENVIAMPAPAHALPFACHHRTERGGWVVSSAAC